jgi:hypothetical protein
MNTTEMLLANSYIQVDTIKGNRYLDDAGKIMNEWDDIFPSKEVGLQGLKMANTNSDIRELHASTERIWVHIELPSNIQYAVATGQPFIKRSADIIQVKEFKRMGLRAQYVVPWDQSEASTLRLTATLFNPALTKQLTDANLSIRAISSQFSFVLEAFSANLQISYVDRSPSAKNAEQLPEKGLMFDWDLFRADGKFTADDLRKFLANGQRWLSDKMPSVALAFIPTGES